MEPTILVGTVFAVLLLCATLLTLYAVSSKVDDLANQLTQADDVARSRNYEMQETLDVVIAAIGALQITCKTDRESLDSPLLSIQESVKILAIVAERQESDLNKRLNSVSDDLRVTHLRTNELIVLAKQQKEKESTPRPRVRPATASEVRTAAEAGGFEAQQTK